MTTVQITTAISALKGGVDIADVGRAAQAAYEMYRAGNGAALAEPGAMASHTWSGVSMSSPIVFTVVVSFIAKPGTEDHAARAASNAMRVVATNNGHGYALHVRASFNGNQSTPV